MAEENEKLRLRPEELERHETGMLEEIKLKIDSFERFEKDGFEEQKLRDVENQNLVEEIGEGSESARADTRTVGEKKFRLGTNYFAARTTSFVLVGSVMKLGRRKISPKQGDG